jgi:single-strand DNA-binding protein
MSSVNKIILLGNVGQEPNTKAFDNGDTVTSFSLATSDQWTDKNGEKRESTEWHNCVCYRQLSKIASDYVKKGSKVFVEGRLKTKSWEKDGVKQYRTDIEVLKLLVLDKKSSVEQSSTSDFPF